MSQSDDDRFKRFQELAGVLSEDSDSRLELLDNLREHLSDTEILETLFEGSFSDEEAKEHLKFISRYHDIDEFDIAL